MLERPPPAPVYNYNEEEEIRELEKKRKGIAATKEGRRSTILTGLLTTEEKPVTSKPELKPKLGG